VSIYMNQSGFEYEIEGDVDFFNELKEMATTSATTNTTGQRCLITDDLLRKDHVTLECGHKFNYIPLYKEVLFQKCFSLPKNISSSIITKYIPSTLPTYQNQNSNVVSIMYNSSYNLETTKLEYNEIKCPYCRSITPYILPYYPYPEVSKVKYVNIPSNMSLPSAPCEYDNFISSGGVNDSTTSCKSLCVYNEKYDMMLCNKHLNKLETTTTTNSSSRKTRTSLKTNTKTHNDYENIIISHHNPATTTCSFVLMSGPRKGCLCGKPMWIPKENNGSYTPLVITNGGAFCKAHYAKGSLL